MPSAAAAGVASDAKSCIPDMTSDMSQPSRPRAPGCSGWEQVFLTPLHPHVRGDPPAESRLSGPTGAAASHKYVSRVPCAALGRCRARLAARNCRTEVERPRFGIPARAASTSSLDSFRKCAAMQVKARARRALASVRFLCGSGAQRAGCPLARPRDGRFPLVCSASADHVPAVPRSSSAGAGPGHDPPIAPDAAPLAGLRSARRKCRCVISNWPPPIRPAGAGVDCRSGPLCGPGQAPGCSQPPRGGPGGEGRVHAGSVVHDDGGEDYAVAQERGGQDFQGRAHSDRRVGQSG